MSKYNRDIKPLHQDDYDLMVQYHELLCLRSELARLLSRSNSSSRARITRKNRSAARTVKRNEGRAFWPPILLLLKPEHPHLGRPAGGTFGPRDFRASVRDKDAAGHGISIPVASVFSSCLIFVGSAKVVTTVKG